MKNPFVYGKEVSKENFCDRGNEIKELKRDIENSQGVLMFSQRRFGKTSLIKRVFEELDQNETIIIYADLYPVIAEEDFIRIYANAISRSITKGLKEKIGDLLLLFKRLRPVYSIDPTGQGSFSVDINRDEMLPMIEDVLQSVNRYVEKTKKNAVVCFDEFQQIGQLKTDRLEKQMRSVFQTHTNISYIFMGSKKHLIKDMFNNPSRPFYKSAKSFPLGKIPKEILGRFIKEKFEITGKQVSDEIVGKIIDECKSHPYYVQYLSHVIWENAIDVSEIVESDIKTSFEIMIRRESSTFEATWDTLTNMQKRFLIALADSEGRKQIFSNSFLSKHGLGASSVQRVVDSLIEKDLVDKTDKIYSIMDIVFRRWINTQSA